MITVNGPFIIAMIVIIYIAAAKWIEWYLFKNDSQRKKERRDKLEGRKKKQKINKSSGIGQMVKRQLFFGKADLKRHWYENIPIAVFIFANSFLNSVLHMEPWQFYLYLFFAVIAIVWFGIFTTFRSNKEFFSAEGQKRRYIKTQILQCALVLLIAAVIFAGLQLSADRRELDPPGLKESMNWVIEPQFEGNWVEFTEGLAPVGYKGKMGFIDKTGNYVILPKYNDADNFHEGLAAVQKDWRWGYIDRNGNVVIPFQFQEAYEFNGGLAPVRKDGKRMVIDRGGAVVLTTDYIRITPFHEGIAVVEIKDKKYKKVTHCNLIDESGNLLLKGNYYIDGSFNEGSIFVRDEEARTGYFIDKHGKRVNSQNLFEASGFSDGIAAVWLESGAYGLMDRSGTIVKDLSEEEYSRYLSVQEGLVMVNNGQWRTSLGDQDLRYGFRDVYGNIVIPVTFRNVMRPSDGLIGIEVNGLWGFIENPVPEAARRIDPALWAADKTQIGTVEGLPLYAGELESRAYEIKEKTPAMIGIPALKQAFEEIKSEKAYQKYGINIEPDKIRYQIGNAYYKRLLLDSR